MAYPYSPVNQVPTSAQTFTPDPQTGSSGATTYLREAPYINAWIMGPSRQVQVPWITALRINCVYEDFQMVPTAGTFVRQPKAGSRLYTITLTRHQGVFQPLVALIRAAYAAPQNSDIRLDRYAVDVLLSYEYQGVAAAANPATAGQSLAGELWQFPKAYAAAGWDTGLVTSATSASDETITFQATAMIYIAGQDIQTTDKPLPVGGWPRLQ